MKIFKQIVFSNIWISLGASIYTYSNYKIANTPPDFIFIALVFFATLFAYNLQRLVRVDSYKDNLSERQQWLFENKKIIFLISNISFLISIVIFLVHFSFKDYLILLPAFVVVLFYASTFVGTKIWGLRDIPFLKIFLISAIWAYVIGVFPLYNSDVNLWSIFTEKFCYIMAITIPFDIRDMYIDDKNKTLPQVLGVFNSKILSVILLIASAIILIYFLNAKISFGLLLFYGLSMIALIFSKQSNPELYFSWFVDGLLMFSFFISI